MEKFFHVSYVALSVACVIAASWFLGDTDPMGYQGAWIFGLTWFPIVVFGFIEYVNAQYLPKTFLRGVQAVFLPYVWVVFFGIVQQQSFVQIVVSASVVTFIAAFFIHGYTLRVPLREAGKSAITEVLIPHLFLYVPAALFAALMIQLLWNADGGSWMFAVGLFAAIVQRVYAMYPQLKNLLS